jgi:hypothetical protein
MFSHVPAEIRILTPGIDVSEFFIDSHMPDPGEFGRM